METPPRKQYLTRYAALKQERNTWLTHWQELSEQIQPRRGRFLANDRNNGGKKNTTIINGTPRRAARILASGMMAGITSPARSWFRLTVPDHMLAESREVSKWLSQVEDILRVAMARSNLYNALHGVYEDLGQFGTSALFLEEDKEDGLRAYNLPVGQYVLANSDRFQVNTVYREFSMTVAQLVSNFTLKKCSESVQDMHRAGNLDKWVDILHCIEPNLNLKTGKSGPEGMKWKSVWLEKAGADESGFLREGGYEEFPVMAPRWNITGEDVYGSSPGMDALGDCRALQLLEKRKAQAIDKVVNPPMNAPTSMLNKRASLLPGDVNYFDGVNGQTFTPAMTIMPQAIGIIGAEVREHEKRINSAFYADLWLMLAESDRRQITAREVSERHEEKMLQLGPVLERLQDELLDPLIDRAFNILLRSGQLPPPPEELQGMELRVEYISMMAAAQKMLGITGIERVASFVGSLAAVKPDVVDKLNLDKIIDEYSDNVGVKPDLINSGEEVDALREGRAKAAQAQAQGQAMAVAAQGAKTLSETDMEGDSALSRLAGTLGGPAGAAVSGN